jgi:hypothetical protein
MQDIQNFVLTWFGFAFETEPKAGQQKQAPVTIHEAAYPAKRMATPKGRDMTPTSSSLSPNWMAKLETA